MAEGLGAALVIETLRIPVPLSLPGLPQPGWQHQLDPPPIIAWPPPPPERNLLQGNQIPRKLRGGDCRCPGAPQGHLSLSGRSSSLQLLHKKRWRGGAGLRGPPPEASHVRALWIPAPALEVDSSFFLSSFEFQLIYEHYLLGKQNATTFLRRQSDFKI